MTESTSPHQGALWQFALDFYGWPGVQTACLHLQDQHGADIPLTLSLLYAATRGHALGLPAIAKLDTASAQLRQAVVRNLRIARRALREDRDEAAQRLREGIKALELEAEHLQMARLAALLPADEQEGQLAPELAALSLDAYAGLLGNRSAKTFAELHDLFRGFWQNLD